MSFLNQISVVLLCFVLVVWLASNWCQWNQIWLVDQACCFAQLVFDHCTVLWRSWTMFCRFVENQGMSQDFCVCFLMVCFWVTKLSFSSHVLRPIYMYLYDNLKWVLFFTKYICTAIEKHIKFVFSPHAWIVHVVSVFYFVTLIIDHF